MNVKRYPQNPILSPNSKNPWESYASFNGSIINTSEGYRLLYRAMSGKQFVNGAELNLSVIGKAESSDAINFINRSLFIKPEETWEAYGCEDPRVTYMDGKYFIFYTALSSFPPGPGSIKVGLAISKDLKTVDEKHLITPFNAKAMTMFPEKINGKYAIILTANTDMPPAKVGIAYFDKIEDIWNQDIWQEWYKNIDNHTITLHWSDIDHVEVGATPVKTKYGYILIYSYIKNYFLEQRLVQIKGVLLDSNDPGKIIGKIKEPLLVPVKEYESQAIVPETIFPTGAIIKDDKLLIYYSGGDETLCLADISLSELYRNIQTNNVLPVKFERFKENPILNPISEHPWESQAVFNPTAIILEGKVHLIYRAVSNDNTSRFGYAISSDGVKIDERLPDPIYEPKEQFEQKKIHGANSGCEDPRITLLDNRLYVCYTAYTGEGDTRVALTSIPLTEFLKRNWSMWEKPILITAPGIYDKDACILPKKINGKYLFLHRITPGISVDYSENLMFGEQNWLRTESYIVPHPHFWDDEKIGIGPTPIETDVGWLLIYHGISKKDSSYRVGAMLMDIKNPQIILSRTEYPILEPVEDYEKHNGRGIVFPCGAVEINDDIYIYYGGGDKNVCVAKISKSRLLTYLVNQSNKTYLEP